MNQSETFTCTCTFLPDTQMSILEIEQKKLHSLLPIHGPLSPFPPFCFTRAQSTKEKLTLLPPVPYNGWIIRPIDDDVNHDDERGTSLVIQFPLFPPLPPVNSFIIGYAGEDAEKMCAELEAKTAISVHVWYYADVSLFLSYEEDTYYSCQYSVENVHWTKRG